VDFDVGTYCKIEEDYGVYILVGFVEKDDEKETAFENTTSCDDDEKATYCSYDAVVGRQTADVWKLIWIDAASILIEIPLVYVKKAFDYTNLPFVLTMTFFYIFLWKTFLKPTFLWLMVYGHPKATSYLTMKDSSSVLKLIANEKKI